MTSGSSGGYFLFRENITCADLSVENPNFQRVAHRKTAFKEDCNATRACVAEFVRKI